MIPFQIQAQKYFLEILLYMLPLYYIHMTVTDAAFSIFINYFQQY